MNKKSWIIFFGFETILILKFVLIIFKMIFDGHTPLLLSITSFMFIFGLFLFSLYCFIDSLFLKTEKKTIVQ